MLAGLGLAPSARAACDTAYDAGAMLDDLVMVEDALRNADGATALRVANKIEAGFPCMNEPVPYMIVGRVFRAVGAGKAMGGDDARGREWILTAIEVDPTFEYGIEDIPADSPIRFTFESAREDAEVGPESLEGSELTKGTHYLDGGLLGGARATMGRPHVYQSDASGTFQSVVIQGNAFPDFALTGAAAVADVEEEGPTRDKKGRIKQPKGPRERVDTGDFYARKRPAEKTPLMIAGGVVMLGAGGVYAIAMGARKNFDESETRVDVDKYKAQTNRMVIISAAVLGVGAGTLTWGIMLDAGGTPVPGININF
jgi:hypothetical protein